MGLSLNTLVEEWADLALTQYDAEARFRAMATRGRAKRGSALLDKLDRAFEAKPA